MIQLGDCFNLQDFVEAARQRLPKPLFHYIAGGADDELTQHANTAAFDRYNLVPRYLRDIRHVDMRKLVLGFDLQWPLLLAPTGMNRLFHPDGEMAVANAAADAGVGYALSTMATTAIEQVAAARAGPRMYQLYLLKDDALNIAMIERCRTAGFDAICLTVDTVVAGNRERDLRNGLSVPPRLGLRNLPRFAQRPRWCLNYLAAGGISLPNVPATGGDKGLSTLAGYFAANMEQNISWGRVEKLMAHWGKPFVIKGLQTVDDARNAAAAGVQGIIVSNHGGRQLDGTAATIDLIADIVDAVGNQLDVILDGGVRRGTHLVKAMAMGASACMLGRPYLYGLAAFGQPGVQRVLSLLKQETQRTLALLGCSSFDDLGRQHVHAADRLPQFLSSTTDPGRSRPLVRSIK